jgi:hypothetical protein
MTKNERQEQKAIKTMVMHRRTTQHDGNADRLLPALLVVVVPFLWSLENGGDCGMMRRFTSRQLVNVRALVMYQLIIYSNDLVTQRIPIGKAGVVVSPLEE